MKTLVILSKASITRSGMFAQSKDPYFLNSSVIPSEGEGPCVSRRVIRSAHEAQQSPRDPSTLQTRRFACSRSAQDDNFAWDRVQA